MESKRKLYMVCMNGDPAWEDERGILWRAHRTVTYFCSWNEARNAIARTRRYAKKNGYTWGYDYMNIVRMVESGIGY